MTMRLGPLFIRAITSIAAFALLVPLAPWLAWGVAAALIVVAGFAAAEALMLRRVTLQVERQPKLALPLGENDVTAIRIGTTSRRPLRLELRQRWPELVAPRSTTKRGFCRPGESVSFDFDLRGVARGEAVIDPAWVALTSRGLVERIAPAGGASTVHVLPNLRAVKRLHKQLNSYALRSIGARAAPRIGKGREFDRMRDYVTDDDYRDIAWKASARHGRLIVQEYRLDRSQEIVVCIDRGHRMAARVEQITRLDHAVNAAVLVSYICNRFEDKVGVLSFDTAPDKGLPTARGAAHLRAVTAYTSQLEAEYRDTDYLALAGGLKKRLHHRTLILIMTVLPEREERHDLLRAVDMLAGQHLPLFLTITDRDLRAAAEMLPSGRDELARTLVARDLWLGRVELTRELRARGALVVDTTAEDAGVDAVNAYINVKRRQLL
jgi:uncharacterized protein (DUF58 family)